MPKTSGSKRLAWRMYIQPDTSLEEARFWSQNKTQPFFVAKASYRCLSKKHRQYLNSTVSTACHPKVPDRSKNP